MDLSPEPDLHPLYPTPADITSLLSQDAGLSPLQKSELVMHCLVRACLFGDIQLLSHLLTDRLPQPYVDLSWQDDDGLGLISTTIQGFGSESERDVEREECVRLLIAQGADVTRADHSGWTPLHHAALLAPPTLITHLMTRGCSLFALTRRKLTALDIVSAHSVVPGREDIALILEEAMRAEGWSGGRMEKRRREIDHRAKRKGKRQSARESVTRVLKLDQKWWGSYESDDSDSSDLDEGLGDDEDIYTPPLDYTSMLVYSPSMLPRIFESLIRNFQPIPRNSEPANSIYMLVRFACLTCDQDWLDELISGTTEALEDTIYGRQDDIILLAFWLYNLTLLLHFLECDKTLAEVLDLLGALEAVDELINAVFVFIIRFVERQLDKLLDTSFMDYAPPNSDFESVQFESEWSFLRSFTSKKKTSGVSPSTSTATIRNPPSSPPPQTTRPSSPPATKGFASLRQSFGRRPNSTPLQAVFGDLPSPADVTNFLTAIHSLLALSGVNPAITTQFFSQVVYWTACEIFNRIMTRKKYLCRSRAVQLGMNLTALEDWVSQSGLPPGILAHFKPVREILHWLQCLSSIEDFAGLIEVVQTLKNINPLQMRRTVRDYKYEVNEPHMIEEFVQYLTQLQKDWERHRVKLGVEALRKEMDEREQDDSDASSPYPADDASRDTSRNSSSESNAGSKEKPVAQEQIDQLFDRSCTQASWEPDKVPRALGELMDSRYMIPLYFPSDPRMLSALPGRLPEDKAGGKRNSATLLAEARMNGERPMDWKLRNKKVREVNIQALKKLDGAHAFARWLKPLPPDSDDENDHHNTTSPPTKMSYMSDSEPVYLSDDPGIYSAGEGEAREKKDRFKAQFTPMARKPSAKGKSKSGHSHEPSMEERGGTQVPA